tara:strand:- start:5886 stop:6506 length:621 start_codon:yes stop_codon:yes gene_type:complete
MKALKVLIACEYSGKVREAFRKLDHEAYSCDLLPSDDRSMYHYEDDIKNVLNYDDTIYDLIVIHPSCQYLAVSGNRWYGKGMPGNDKRLASLEWTLDLWELVKEKSHHAAMENPVSVLFSNIDAKVQYVQPWQFGHGETKKTGLALHNLPDLVPSNIVAGRDDRIHKMPPSKDRWKLRSETYQGIADAMAEQWGSYLQSKSTEEAL